MGISTPRGIALYVGALLGPGLLVLPGLAAAQAGPASILAWAGLLLLSGLVATVFARFGTDFPSAAGVAEYTERGLGRRAGRAVSWCFLAGIITGAPIVCTMGAGYLTLHKATGGAVILALMIALSRGKVRASTGVQLILVAILLLVIAVAVGGSATSSSAGNFTPFAPHGWSAIGRAASVLMLSFVGWEAVAPLTGRFTRPARVIGAAFAITAATYLALATVTIAALGTDAGTEVPMAALLEKAIGHAGHPVAAIAALLLTMGTVNAYLTGGAALSRTFGSRSGRWFSISVGTAGAVIVGLIGAGAVSVAGAVTIPAAFFLVVYLGCMLSAIRAMPGRPRAIAVVAAAAILLILRYAGPAVIPAILVAVAAAVPRPAPSSTSASWSRSSTAT